MMNELSKDCGVYAYKDDIWLINPNTKEWIVSYYSKTKYAWWNYEFFKNVYNFISMDIKDYASAESYHSERQDLTYLMYNFV